MKYIEAMQRKNVVRINRINKNFKLLEKYLNVDTRKLHSIDIYNYAVLATHIDYDIEFILDCKFTDIQLDEIFTNMFGSVFAYWYKHNHNIFVSRLHSIIQE